MGHLGENQDGIGDSNSTVNPFDHLTFIENYPKHQEAAFSFQMRV